MKTITPAMAIARHIGAEGRRGGWIYIDDKPLCHGWFAFEQLCRRRGWIVARQAPLSDCVNWRKVPANPIS